MPVLSGLRTGKFGNVTIDLNTKQYKKIVKDVGENVTEASKDTKIMRQMAAAIIVYSADLVPYRDEYKMRKRIPKNPKTGKLKKIGRTRTINGVKDTISNNEYYKTKYFNEITEENNWQRTDYKKTYQTTSLVPKNIYKYATIKDENGKVHKIKTGVADIKLVPKTVTHTYYGGVGTVATGGTHKVIKRNYFRESGGEDGLKPAFRDYLDKTHRYYHKITEKEATSGEYKPDIHHRKWKTGDIVADRPPHLKESYTAVNSHGGIAIRYSVRKKPDDHYIDSDGSGDYAAKQYFGPDKNWKRFSPGTTSRWLEVAIGADLGNDAALVKIPEIPEGKQNFEKIKEAVANEIIDKYG